VTRGSKSKSDHRLPSQNQRRAIAEKVKSGRQTARDGNKQRSSAYGEGVAIGWEQQLAEKENREDRHSGETSDDHIPSFDETAELTSALLVTNPSKRFRGKRDDLFRELHKIIATIAL
jgi:hypothetical protein